LGFYHFKPLDFLPSLIKSRHQLRFKTSISRPDPENEKSQREIYTLIKKDNKWLIDAVSVIKVNEAGKELIL
jgi:hypothetical protein